MLRLSSLVIAVIASQVAFSDFALADPDHSLVRITLDEQSSRVEVSGRTRTLFVDAVFAAMERCGRPAEDGVTVGPWLRLPEVRSKDPDDRTQITVFFGDSFEGGATTAYIGVPPKTPFKIVSAISGQLRAVGFTDVRLLSDSTVRTEILPLAGHQPPPAQPNTPQ